MDLDFSQEQKAIGEQARRFLTEKQSLGCARKVLEGEQSHDQQLWREMADMGWQGIAIPEQYGGVGMGYLELCVLAEQLGRALAPVPFSSTVYLFAEALLQYGSEEQKKQWLPKVAAGEVAGTLAIAEHREAPTADRIGCSFSGGRLSGRKIAVPDGDIADAAVVVAKDGGKLRLALVSLKSSGVSSEAVASVDGSRSYAILRFDGAEAEALGGEAEDGWSQMNSVLDRAAVLYAFEQLGLADEAMDMARNYALERYAFGRPIGSYQAVKHKLADMYVLAQLGRSNCYRAAWALSTSDASLPVAAAAARVSATEAAEFNSQENIQLHGGMGFTWEFDCHLFYRRSKGLALVVGGIGEWKDRLISGLEQSNRQQGSN